MRFTGSKMHQPRSASIAGFVVGVVGGFFSLGVVNCGGIDEPDFFVPVDSGSSDGRSDARGADGAVKDASKVDAGSVGQGTVQCTPGPCAISSNQACCYSIDTQTGTCDLANNCNGGNQFPIPCDSTQDCADLGKPDELCCAQAGNSGSVTNVECQPAANCRADQGQTNLCDPNVAAPCPNGGTCTPSTVSLPGYYICVM